jgi:Holliday junction resolvase-like predicted endonuclease
MDRAKIGKLGENLVVDYLIKDNYIILEKNKQIIIDNIKKTEVDILAQKDNKYFLFEVKYRSNNKFGNLYESVIQEKIERLYLAHQYLSPFYSPLYIKIALVNKSNIVITNI